MQHDFDVLIVGSGLAGGSLALGLAGLGLRVAVVEALSEQQRQASSVGERALALAYGSTQILQQIGVWPAAEKKSAPIRHIHVSDRGHFGKLRMSAEQQDVPALGYVVTARVLEDEIATRLHASSVTVICPAQVLGVTAGAQGVHVSAKQGEGCINLSARLLVAADGGNSSVRRLLEIGQTQRDYGQTAIVTEVTTGISRDFTAYERFTTAGPLAFLPMGRKRYSVVWTQKTDDAAELLALPEAEFTHQLQAAFGFWLGRVTLAARRQGFPLKLIRAEKMVAERTVLVGNAMHQLHPVAGQGLNLGLRDVALLAEMLSAKLAFGEDIGDAAFLASYAKARQADLDRVVSFTDGTVLLFSSAMVPLSVARNTGLLVLDRVSIGKSALARHAMGLGHRIARFG